VANEIIGTIKFEYGPGLSNIPTILNCDMEGTAFTYCNIP
jgi:hypothetical protein